MFPLNLPNTITVGRILLVPVVVVVVVDLTPGGSWVAAALFALVASTDGLDGWIARRNRDVTTFGKVADPVADKLLVAAVLIALVDLDRLAAWVAMVIIAREFAVTGLRIAAAQQGAVISASQLGKAKTLSQIAAVVALIAVPDPDVAWIQVLVYLTVAVTVASGIDYFLNVRRRIDTARERAAERTAQRLRAKGEAAES